MISTSLRWGGLIACGCVLFAALGSYALTQRRDTIAVARAAPEWSSDLRRSIDTAKAEQKDLLLQFSAPNAAGPAESGVLDTELSRRSLGETFVLVRLAPTSEMSPAQLTALTTWAQRLGVARFPTFVLLDADARAYAKSELSTADLQSYLAEFGKLRETRSRRDQAIALAAQSTGIERAKLLDRALGEVGTFAASEYPEIQQQIVALDPQNVAGLKSKYESPVAARQLDGVIQNEIYPLADRGKYRDAIARLDRLVAEIKPPRLELQLLTAFKGQLYYSLGEKKRAAQFLDEAIALDPRSESAARARAAKLQLAGLP